ncbi:hypothetical protein CEUSTIGMA_g12259.t1 [Chlamydomonas eustigma]|uniref:Uncharacterized protein n=1 Tax=Chlamydomonas eustigma TaxID=1157962 RepID=A0A250XP53_9CHLO|nr:hypothetical protein CEUSTIGMA_g12259.t1 [Chlamydomonas eustigma]|eukprot:GAX84838.1 hypothetical protein CEUSTIGMA_g12259.t1 [Chlamydomonas eustigma]
MAILLAKLSMAYSQAFAARLAQTIPAKSAPLFRMSSPDVFESNIQRLVHYIISENRCTFASSTGPTASSVAASPSTASHQIVTLPKLSHQMTQGKLIKWLKSPGDHIHMYDVLMEVETEELVENVFKVGDFAGEVTLLVESQEEGYLAEILVDAGPSLVPVGRPVAVLVESQEDLLKWQEHLAKRPTPGLKWQCPTTNVYDDTQPPVAVLPWQSFLKSSTRKVKCMG